MNMIRERLVSEGARGAVRTVVLAMIVLLALLAATSVIASDPVEAFPEAAGGVELLDKAAPTSRHFLLPDGSVQAYFTTGPLWYQQSDGDWETIDTTITMAGDKFANETNNFKTFIPANHAEDTQVLLSTGEWISIGHFQLRGEASGLPEFKNVPGLAGGSKVVFQGVAHAASEEMVIRSTGLKHNLNLEKLPGWLDVKKAVWLENIVTVPAETLVYAGETLVTYEIEGSGPTAFRFTDPSGRRLFEISTPIAYESKDITKQVPLSETLTYLSPGRYLLKTYLPLTWLEKAGRSFPVVIDPVYVFVPPVADGMIDHKNITTNYGSLTTMDCNAKSGFEQRDLIKFDFSTIPYFSCINSASLDLYNVDHDNGRTLNLYRLTRDWVESQFTWNISQTGTNWTVAGGDYDYNVVAQRATDALYPGWEPFNVQSIIQNWIDQVYPHYGMILTDNQEGTANEWIRFNTKEAGIYQPQLTVNYNTVTVSISMGACALGNVQLTANVTGNGTPPYSYYWMPGGATTSSITVSGNGTTYTCTVTDSATPTCDGQAQRTTTVCPTCISSATNTPSGSTSVCAGSTVQLTAAASNGTGPFTYLWSPGGQTTQSINAAPGFTYYCAVTDTAVGCGNTVQTNSVSVTALPTPIPIITPSGPTTFCAGGSVQLTASDNGGATPPYTYLWSPGGQTTASITVSASGSYYVTMTATSNGCSANSAATNVTVNPNPTVTITAGSCSVGNVVLTANPSGGTAPYTYLWSPGGATTSSITVPGNGVTSYTVQVTDSKSCSGTSSPYTVPSCPPCITSATNAAGGSTTFCQGGSVQLTATPVGGTGPYTYLWSPGGATTQTMNATASGSYTCQVTDTGATCGNTVTTNAVVVTVNPNPTATITEGACNLGQVILTANPSGGTAPYTYLWSPGGATTSTITVPGNGTGSYTVTVTDANTCSGVSAPHTVVLCMPCISSATNAAGGSTTFCDGGSVQLTATPVGGTGPFTYLWSPGGATTQSINATASGSYTCQVKDNDPTCGNTVTTNAVVVTVNPNPTVTITEGACISGNVILTANPSGGTAPYTYLWNPGGATTSTITVPGNGTGSYTVTVTDSLTCSGVSAPHVVKLCMPCVSSATNAAGGSTTFCQGGSVQLTATPVGGTGPFSYLWTPGGATTQSINATASGSYTCEVTDNDPTCGNKVTTNAVVVTVNPNPTVTITEGACNVGQVILTANPSGGTAPYTYLWSPGGATTSTITVAGDGATSYTVTVTDANTCSGASAPHTVALCPTCISSATNGAGGSTTFCDGGSVQLTATPVNGVGPFTYLWTPGGATTQSINVTASGSYTCQVTDTGATCGNSVTTNAVVVTVNPNPSVTISESACSVGNVTLTANPSGGTGPYTYLWAPGGQSTPTIIVPGDGVNVYTVTVTDNNSCTGVSAPHTVTLCPTCISSATNGASGNTTFCDGGSVQLTATAANGVGPFTYLWTPGGATTQSINATASGSYTCQVTDTGATCGNSVTTNAIVVTVNPNPTVTITEGACNVGQVILTANPSGGTGPFTYLWAPGGSTTASITVAGDGSTSYTVTVTDANSCSGVSAPHTVALCPTCISSATNAAGGPVTFCDGGSVQLTATATNGVGPFTYLWTPGGATTQSITVTTSGSYTCQVTDTGATCGNSVTTNAVVVTVNPNPTVTITEGACNMGNVILTANPAGGTGPYTYLWNPGGATTASITVPGDGVTSYTVTVTDVNTCSGVSAPHLVTLCGTCVTGAANAAGGATTFCAGGSVQLTATPVDGVGPFTYLWTPGGATTSSITVTTSGSYYCQITDTALACGNTVTSNTIVVTVNPNPTVTISESACSLGNVILTANPVGGTAPYTYLWAPGGATTASITVPGDGVGTYTVTVTDANTCSGVSAPHTVGLCGTCITGATNAAGGSTTFCEGGSVQLTATPANGVGPFTYLWTPGGATTQSVTVTTSGSYSCLVTDTDPTCGNSVTTNTVVVTVNPNPAVYPYFIPTMTVNQPYSTTFTAAGGAVPYTYVQTGTLPVGLSFVDDTLSGTPTETGNFPITVTTTDANGCQGSRDYLLTVECAATTVEIAPNYIPSVEVGTAYTPTNFTVSGGTSPYVFIKVGALPTGMNFVDNGDGTATLSGTPTQSGIFPITVGAEDDNGCAGSRDYTLVVECVSNSIAIAPATLANGTTRAAYSQLFTASGGSGTYSYWVKAGRLPSGLSFVDNGNGTASLSGTPLKTGTFWFMVAVMDNAGCPGMKSYSLTITCETINPPTTTGASRCGAGTVTLTAADASAYQDYKWYDAATGGNLLQTGGDTFITPVISTTTTYWVSIYDTVATNCESTRASVTATVNPAPSVTITPNGPTTFCDGGSVTLDAGVHSTYLWTPGGATTQSIIVTTGGSYTVEVTDPGCPPVTSDPVVVTVNPNPTATITEGACSLGNVILTANPAGGTAPYTYLWAPGGATTASITVPGDGATSYTVTVTDANTCSGTSAPHAVALCGTCISSATNAAGGTRMFCDGGSVQLTATADNGVGPFTYLWTPGGATTQSITVTTSGSYYCQVTDTDPTCGNTVTTNTLDVVVYPNPTATITEGACNVGQVILTANPSGGTGPYTYLWAPGGATTPTITVAGDGVSSYTVTVTDSHSCSGISGAHVVQLCPTCISSATNAAGGPVTFCDGGSVQLTATATNGVGPFTYLWSPGGATTQSITVTTSGSYTCQVTDTGATCGNTVTTNAVVVTVNPNPTVTITEGACISGNVILTANPTGGTSPYTYLWNPGGATTNTITVPGDGVSSYTVTVTGQKGCSGTSAPYTVRLCGTCITGATNTAGGATTFCAGGSVQLTAAPVDGVGPFTYLWTPGGATTSSITVTTSGSYYCQITDTAPACNNTVTSNTVVVTVNTNPTVTISESACSLGNVILTANPVGGTGPYTYLWAPGGATTASITVPGDGVGSYTVTVVDFNSCSGVSAPHTVALCGTCISGATNDPTGNTTICQGGSVLLTANPTNGVGPFTFLWSPGNQTTQAITVTAAGSYSCLVTDTDPTCGNSVTTNTVVVTVNPNPVVYPFFIPNITVNLPYSATFTAAGGTAPYGFVQTGTLPAGLSFVGDTLSGTPTETGNFAITVTTTDANGCQGSRNYLLTVECAATTVAIAPDYIPSGTVANAYTATNFTATGGSSPYTFIIVGALPTGMTFVDNGDGTATLSGTPTQSGIFPITVGAEDNNECAGSRDYTLVIECESTTITISPSSLPNGTARTAYSQTFTAAGGAGNILYWVKAGRLPSGLSFVDNGNGTATLSGTPVKTGTFWFMVAAMDLSGCPGYKSYSLTVSCDTIDPPVTTGASRCGSGTLTLYAAGATAYQDYKWYDAETGGTLLQTGGTSYTTPSLAVTTTYWVSIYDTASNCESARASVTATINAAPTVTITPSGPTTFCSGGSVTLDAGSHATYLWSPGGQTTQSILVTTSDTYSVVVTDPGCMPVESDPVDVTVNPTPAVNITSGACSLGNVILTANASGGTAPLSYLWSPGGATTSSITVPGDGTTSYTVTVTDSLTCFAVSAPHTVALCGSCISSATADPDGPTTFCNGHDVLLTANPVGGVGPFTYLWSPGGATTQSVTVLTGGSYSCQVTDTDPTCGNTVTTNTVNVTVYPNPTVTISEGSCSLGNVILTANPAGGTAPYTYLWFPGGATTPAITVPGNGTSSYSVAVWDTNSCSVTSTPHTVQLCPTCISSATNTAGGPTEFCNGGSVQLTASANNGVGPFTYLWSPGGATTSSITVTTAGSYTCQVTDTNAACGNSVTTNAVAVTVNPNPTVTITEGACNLGNVVLTANPTGGTAPYTYLWSPGGATTNTITVPGDGVSSYTVTVTGQKGCSGTSAPYTVKLCGTCISAATASAGGPTTFCMGGSVQLTATPTNGVGPFTYLWSPGGATTQSVVVNTSGSYSCQVTDTGVGCGNTVTTNSVSVTVIPSEPPTMPVLVTNGILVTPQSYARFFMADPNAGINVTGYNMYRATDCTVAKATWPRIGTNLPDENGAAPDVQLTDPTSDNPPAPGNVWFYVFTAFNELCNAEGPFGSGAEFTINLPGDVPLTMVRIEPGTFQMGAYAGEVSAEGREYPQHPVSFSETFYMGKYEVTQGQWEALMGSNPSAGYGVGSNYPVYNVSWNMINGTGGFLEALNQHLTSTNQLGANKFRLPSESEWEYSCRAGTTSRFWYGDASFPCDEACGSCMLHDAHMVWCGNDNNKCEPVGSKGINPWGIYDMHGNVWEWVQDWFHNSYDGAPQDGSAWESPTGSFRVLRGGMWSLLAQNCRSASRYADYPSWINNKVGFRLAMSE